MKGSLHQNLNCHSIYLKNAFTDKFNNWQKKSSKNFLDFYVLKEFKNGKNRLYIDNLILISIKLLLLYEGLRDKV